MKIGDKLIKVISSRYRHDVVEVLEIKKINKQTYSLSNGDLIYIETLRPRESRNVWNSDFSKFTPFNDDEYTAIKNKIAENKYQSFKSDFEKCKFNIEFVKRYISEFKEEV